MTSKNGNEIAVLHSIRRPHSDRIKTRVKRWEIRKTKPSIPTPFTDYIYEPKSGGGCGKVIGEFICDKIIVVDCDSVALFDRQTKRYLSDEACLTAEEARRYLGIMCGYGLHISQLKIYDKPKELSEFCRPCTFAAGCYLCDESGFALDGNIDCFNRIKRAPQSWCYVEEIY